MSVTRQFITLLKSHTSVSGATSLFAGTGTRLYRSTPGESWILLGDGFGGDPDCMPDDETPEYSSMIKVRWQAAFLGDIGLFANGVDYLQFYSINGEPVSTGSLDLTSEVAYEYLQPVDDLIALDILNPRLVQSYAGFAFVASPVVSGERKESQIYWSDFNSPLSWIPGENSMAGYIDLGGGEKVLAMEPLGGRMKIHTDKAIYNAYFVGGDEVWRVEEVYRGPDTIYFPNSLVNTGKEHLYIGKDSIFVVTEFDRAPRQYDWLDQCSAAIFEGVPEHIVSDLPSAGGSSVILDSFCPVNEDACYATVGGYDGEERFVWFSWPTADDDGRNVPNRSLVIHLDTKTSCVVDNGFTAFESSFRQSGMTLSQWLYHSCICNPRVIVNEGNPVMDSDCSVIPPVGVTCLVHPNENQVDFYLTDPSEIPHANSWCAWADANGKDCLDCSECVTPHVFVMADAEDKCLKQYDPDFYAREVLESQETCGWCNVPDDPETFLSDEKEMECPEGSESMLMLPHPNGLPVYRRNNYAILWQTDPDDNKTPADNTIHAVRVTYDRRVDDCYPIDDGVPSTQTQEWLYAQAGRTNSPGCVIWDDDDPQELKCPSSETLKSYARDDHRITFRFLTTGEFIAFRMFAGSNRSDGDWIGKLSLNDVTLDIGGDCRWHWS